MAGRPKREEEVTSVLLRLPPVLLKRIERCQAMLALQEDARLTRTEAFWRILEAGCWTLEGVRKASVKPTPTQEISEISSISISKISEISNDDMPGYDFHDEVEQPADVPQVSETPRATAEPIEAQRPLVETPVHYGRPGIPRETLQAIADERTLCEGLGIREFSQRLFDKDIYRAKAKDGRAVPVDHSRLRRWLAQARRAGLL